MTGKERVERKEKIEKELLPFKEYINKKVVELEQLLSIGITIELEKESGKYRLGVLDKISIT